ncbi:MAG: heme NO-binding domain-containing protein [Planctomycetota bacterium]
MKGVVFTNLFELVESEFGYETLDRVLEKCELENDGAYTSVGTYTCGELVQIVSALSEELNMPIPDLIKFFGGYLFGQFFNAHADMLTEYTTAFDLLLAVEEIIHVEVKKLWAHAELPTFEYERPSDSELVMIYQSTRPFADLCEGLIQACVEHYDEPIEIRRENISPDGTSARFHLCLTC